MSGEGASMRQPALAGLRQPAECVGRHSTHRDRGLSANRGGMLQEHACSSRAKFNVSQAIFISKKVWSSTSSVKRQAGLVWLSSHVLLHSRFIRLLASMENGQTFTRTAERERLRSHSSVTQSFSGQILLSLYHLLSVY